MRRMFFIGMVVLAMMFPVNFAAAQNPLDQSPSDTIQLNKEQLDQFIKTLENDTARKDFIDNLKALSDVQQQQQDQAAPILDLSQTTGGWVTAYENFVNKLGIRQGLIGQIAASIVTVLLWVAAMIFVHRASLVLRDRLNRLRNRYQLGHNRFRLYSRYIRYAGYVVISGFMIYMMAFIWGMTAGDWSISDTGKTVLVNTLNVILVTTIAIALWEVVNTMLENYIRRLDPAQSNRLLTLIPIARNIFMVVFILLFALVVLSEIGVNIFPLLAGAGVLGIAVGLGAQNMIKDFLTGFTIIFEDLIQVGDVATLGGKTGLIEKITIRKVQLRDVSGIVYTIPFSEISIVENWTKDFSFYSMDIPIAYREDTDQVIQYLREVDEDIRNDEKYSALILAPIDIMGVDRFVDSAVIIKARIKTLPIKQWEVGREFNRRMKYKFDAMGVEIPFPHQTLYFGQDKNGKAPAAMVELLSSQAVEKKTSANRKKP